MPPASTLSKKTRPSASKLHLEVFYKGAGTISLAVSCFAMFFK